MATFCATCLANLLGDKLHRKKLPNTAYPATGSSRIFSVRKVELGSTFHHDCRNAETIFSNIASPPGNNGYNVPSDPNFPRSAPQSPRHNLHHLYHLQPCIFPLPFPLSSKKTSRNSFAFCPVSRLTTFESLSFFKNLSKSSTSYKTTIKHKF